MKKKTSHYFITLILGIFAAAMLLHGCGQVSDSGTVSEDTKVTNAILSSDLFTDTVATDETSSVNISSVQSSVGDPVNGWRRFLSTASRSFGSTILGNEATVNVTTLLIGTLNIYKVTDNVLTAATTTYNVKDTRTVHATRIDGQWAVTKISPTLITMVNSANQTVGVTSVTLKGTDPSNNPVTFTYNNPTQMYSISELPVFKSDTLIIAEATVINSSPSTLNPTMFTFVHHPSSIQLVMATRQKMFDDGITNLNLLIRRADQVAGDGIYTRGWYAGLAGRRHAWFDVIDSRTVADPVLNGYNSGGLVLPYRVQ